MTLDEAIRHAEEVAEYDCYNDEQKKCADEHRQLAEWLRELKRLRESATDTDTISRQAAMAYPLSWEHYDKEHGDRKFISGVESYREYIEQLPSAQPEIIRCKDCKQKYLDNMIWNCPFGLPGGEDFFCAYGAKGGDSDDE